MSVQEAERAEPQFQETVEQQRLEIQDSVFRLYDDLRDQDSELNQTFYSSKELGGVEETPLRRYLGATNGHLVMVKDETHHDVVANGTSYVAKSFKRRGAWLDILHASQLGALSELTTQSHGNHLESVALAGLIKNIPVTGHVPFDTDSTRKAYLQSLGVRLFDSYANFEEADEGCRLYAQNTGAHNTHPFDSETVMAGQGTVTMEILDQLIDMHRGGLLNVYEDDINLVYAVAGGGLLASGSLAIEYYKNLGLIGSGVSAHGSELVGDNAAYRTRLFSDEYNIADLDLFAPGEKNHRSPSTDVQRLGAKTAPFVCDPSYVSTLATLSELETAGGMRQVSSVLHKQVEPAAGLAMARALQLASETPKPRDNQGKQSVFVAVACGANQSVENAEHFKRIEFEQYQQTLGSIATFPKLARVRPSETPRGLQIASGMVLR